MPLILSKQHKNVIFLALVPRPTILVWLSIKVLFAKVSKRFSWHIVYTYTLYKKTSWEWIQEKYIARRGYLNTILKSIFENHYKTFFKKLFFSSFLFELHLLFQASKIPEAIYFKSNIFTSVHKCQLIIYKGMLTNWGSYLKQLSSMNIYISIRESSRIMHKISENGE